MTSYVYFLQCNQFIKIGRAIDPRSRISGIRTANPFQITVLGVMPGGEKEEKSLHAQFQYLRHNGEWFFATSELLAFINSNCEAKPTKATTNKLRSTARTRHGKKGFTVFLSDHAHSIIKNLASEEGATLIDLYEEGLNYVLHKRGRPTIA